VPDNLGVPCRKRSPGKRPLIASAIFFLLFSVSDDARPRPSAPEGYSWQSLQDVGAQGLKPDGWCFSQRREGKSIVYRITEKAPKKRCFLTGLTVNVVKSVGKESRINAPVYAAFYIYDYIAKSAQVKEKWNRTEEPFVLYGCEVTRKVQAVDPKLDFRVRVTAVANTKTDTLYVMIFGTPEKDWERTGETGKTLLENMVLDKNY
jgi:hypothetical protein